MGILDAIRGRTKPVRANLDALFALPAAAVTLQVTAGLTSSGHAGVCFKPPAGQPFAQMQADLEQLLRSDTSGAPDGAASVRDVGDKYGYRWILVEAGNIDDLVTRAHMVHSSLEDAGWSTQLLCSVFGFRPGTGVDPVTGGDPVTVAGDDPAGGAAAEAITRPIYLVYLAKQGTFYPFAPLDDEQRDNELELRVRGMLGDDLPIEKDLARWFPVWDLPVE
jgi:PspAB-like protein